MFRKPGLPLKRGKLPRCLCAIPLSLPSKHFPRFSSEVVESIYTSRQKVRLRPPPTLLSEDLYNDFFSHSGPEIKMGLRQNLPLGLNVSIDALAQRLHKRGQDAAA